MTSVSLSDHDSDPGAMTGDRRRGNLDSIQNRHSHENIIISSSITADLAVSLSLSHSPSPSCSFYLSLLTIPAPLGAGLSDLKMAGGWRGVDIMSHHV